MTDSIDWLGKHSSGTNIALLGQLQCKQAAFLSADTWKLLCTVALQKPDAQLAEFHD